MLNNKKGESLVEVLVALSIFMLVFAGVVTMITGSVTLNLSARQRTETVAMVQKNLNLYLASTDNGGSCTIQGLGPSVIDSAYSNSSCAAPLVSGANPCYYVEVKDLDPTETNSTLDLVNSKFIKVTSHGKWYARFLGQQEFQVSRIVRNY